MPVQKCIPFIAEKLPLLLGHGGFENVNNIIERPIYLPALDVANGMIVDPEADTVVTTPTLPGAAVTVPAGSLQDQQGMPFTGVLSITEVPQDLTPAALPEDLSPGMVVTIQPGEMVFTVPAPLRLPNTNGVPPGTEMDLWSISPITGEFEVVGTGVVSADGTTVDTVEGGIRNSSWHTFSWLFGSGKKDNKFNQDKRCDDCEEREDPNDDNQSEKKPNFPDDDEGPRDQNRTPEAFDDEVTVEPGAGRRRRIPNGSDVLDQERMPFQNQRGYSEGKPDWSTGNGSPDSPSRQQGDDSFFGSNSYSFQVETRPAFGEPANRDPSRSSHFLKPQGIGAGHLTGESQVAMHSGAVYKRHYLAPYQSLGAPRGLILQYDSERADATQIIHYGYNEMANNLPSLFMISSLSIEQTASIGFRQLAPVDQGSSQPNGLLPGERVFALADDDTVDAAFVEDLRHLPTGQYQYTVRSRFTTGGFSNVVGSPDPITDSFIHVNSIDSPFGSGWGLTGLQHLVENHDGSVLLIDGDGGELLYTPPVIPGQPFGNSPGDFSTFELQPDGTYRRTMPDQTMFQFNADNDVALLRDRNGNEIQFQYAAARKISKVIDPVGLETTFEYTGDRITKIIDPAQRETDLEYDSNGNLTKITDPDGEFREFEYDNRNRLTTETDKRGNIEGTIYDFSGRALTTIRKDGTKVHYRPAQSQASSPTQRYGGLVPGTVSQLGNPISQFADSNGNVKETELGSRWAAHVSNRFRRRASKDHSKCRQPDFSRDRCARERDGL